MKLKNVLIVVDDIERSKAFYKELFGLSVILDGEANVMMSGGLVLQDRRVWENAIGNEVCYKGCDTLLYFEDSDLKSFQKKLDESGYGIEYVTKEESIIRMYDLDGHIIEIRQVL
ncbi:MAG: glyoxalase [Lachnospira sp.]|nr:glyoxalase [Lachnospira sp.]